jgi:hypothetical protein
MVAIVTPVVSVRAVGTTLNENFDYAKEIVKFPELIWNVSPVSIVFEVVTAP